MKFKPALLLIILTITYYQTTAQKIKAGFNPQEYKELLAISVKNYYPSETKNIPYPANYERKYRSQPMGLDNVWELWTNTDSIAVISIRGTSADPSSFLANAYAAMVSAKGKLTIAENNVFEYELSENPKAAVHIGWLTSMAFLSQDIIPKIDSCYQTGIKDIYITGHSQGGAIAILMTSYFSNLQKQGIIPQDIRFKTYSSAGPKVGNQYFANNYSILTQDGWGYNVINPNDWVPESFLTVQTMEDFPDINIFATVKEGIDNQSFFKKIMGKALYNKVANPSKKAQRKYQKYFGKMVSNKIKEKLPGFISPTYYHSSNYIQSGNIYVLKADSDYHKLFPYDKTKLMQHHQPNAYYYLINEVLKRDSTNR
ncbi:lipase family protein [Formosa undariae]|uniref:Lipase family protein n=1 Tax=Formosa undariae TaxID=1325436 RepID=A0ABV5EY55_9FLAO